MDLTEATVDEVIHHWSTEEGLPELVNAVLPLDVPVMNASVEAVDNAVPADAFFEGSVDRASARALGARSRALYAVALLLAARKQTKHLQKRGLIPNRGHYLKASLPPRTSRTL